MISSGNLILLVGVLFVAQIGVSLFLQRSKPPVSRQSGPDNQNPLVASSDYCRGMSTCPEARIRAFQAWDHPHAYKCESSFDAGWHAGRAMLLKQIREHEATHLRSTLN